MLKNKSAYKYGTPYNGIYVIIQTLTNITAILKMGEITNRYNKDQINPYKTKINVDYVDI